MIVIKMIKHHQESLETHQLVTDVLHIMAKEAKQPYRKIKRIFRFESHPAVILRFWWLLTKNYPGHSFNEVSYCNDCNRFSLDYDPTNPTIEQMLQLVHEIDD